MVRLVTYICLNTVNKFGYQLFYSKKEKKHKESPTLNIVTE